MKHLVHRYARAALVFALATLVMSCDKEIPELRIGNWGPQSMVLGEIPNIQPDGGLGLWIEVTGGEGPTDIQIIFDGVPLHTAVHERVSTVSVPPARLKQPGNRDVALRQVSTGKLFPVGIFVIKPRQ
jgi:hypothetical protein